MKRFLGQVLATMTGTLLSAFLLVGGMFLLLVLIGTTMEPPAPRVSRDSVLVVDLSSPITDRGLDASPGAALFGAGLPPMALRHAVGALDEAAEDDRISAVLLRGSVAPLGWASMRELRGALERVKAAGKTIVAHFPALDERTYYLASLAEPLYVAPLGAVELDGLSAELLYFGEALRELGVGVQVTKVGGFKTYAEPFTNDGMSDAEREQTSAWLGEIWDEFLATSLGARGVDPASLEADIAAGGLFTAEEAVERGLIDGVRAFDEILVEMRGLAGEWRDSFRQVTLRQYAQASDPDRRGSRSGGVVAVVYAEGTILDGDAETDVHGDTVARALRAVRFDDDVDAVVLRVNSGGGSASASEVILREMELLKADKPVVVSMGDVAASGGYWISCKADEIFVQPTTITGSIGVVGMFPNVEEMLGGWGIHSDVVKTAPHADQWSTYRPRSDEELVSIQRLVDDVYDGFLDRVSSGRDLPREDVLAIAEGRVWSGSDAIEVGLADTFGGLEDAIASAARRAGLGEEYAVEFPRIERTFLDELVEAMLEEELDGEPLTGIALRELPFDSLARAFRSAALLASSRGVLARMPFEIVVH